MIKADIITFFRIRISDPAGTNQLFDDSTYEKILNDGSYTIIGTSTNIDNISEVNISKLIAYSEFQYYYKLARDTAFYFKYKEAQGDYVDKVKTADYFLKLAKEKQDLYFKMYGTGAISTTYGIGNLFKFGE